VATATTSGAPLSSISPGEVRNSSELASSTSRCDPKPGCSMFSYQAIPLASEVCSNKSLRLSPLRSGVENCPTSSGDSRIACVLNPSPVFSCQAAFNSLLLPDLEMISGSPSPSRSALKTSFGSAWSPLTDSAGPNPSSASGSASSS
jgi:hypothetical protein